ncbi:CHAT domain-containing protein [Aspergillus parasiticus]|uniref:CHAT domain-containing protein n=1 Tax=Aspergillus parasiticus TaxID=5067 RepID=A0A5N6DTI3_ASPPA|nr:CHAT domain-containing protein [Aspergillus parasiticus]
MLGDRYEHTGQIEDLGLTIKALRSAAQVTYDTCPDLVTYLSDLGYGLTIRYERTWEMKDPAEVIEVFRKVVQATPDTCPDLANYLTKPGVELTRRYERKGRTEDLDEAVQVSRRAVQTTADTSPDLATHFTNLGYRLVLRYERINKMDDLKEAMTLSRQAVEANYNNNSGSIASVGNLSRVLLYRYKRTKQTDHLEEAYHICRKAVQITPVDDPYHGKWLCNLAHILTERYEHTRQRKDLEVAIWWSRKSIHASFDGDVDLRAQYNNLGTMLVTRYEQTWQLSDLEEAIRISRRAINATPDDHPYLVGQLKNLGAVLTSQYERIGCLEDLEEAIRVSRKAARITSALPLECISAASLTIRLMLKQEDYNNSYALCVEALDLLQLVCSRHLTLEDQQYVVSHFSGLATLACSLALQVRQPPFRALQLLEAGRSVIFDLIMDDRSNTSKLEVTDPTLCALHEELRLEINDPAESSQSQYVDEDVPTRRLKALKKLEKYASISGSIIVVNVTRLRSDAIVVSQAGFSLIPLPGLGAVQAQRWIDQEMTSASSSQRGEKNKKYREFLGWLWYEYVEPILTKLGYNVQSSPENLPRTWWIGTGLASSFPFHAARGFRADENDNTSSRVLSSYTTTIKALLHAKERVPASSPNEQLLNLLMVTMAHTPGEDDLPGVECKWSMVLDLLGSSVHVNKLDQPDSASVMRQIGDCHIAHFVCHGMSDLADPFQSGLLLQTNTTIPEKEILSVRKLCKQSLTHGEIAYLSACSTAENRAKQLLDEVVHVVNGFQVAGFRHVIGALWPSDDRVCVKVAKLFYIEICPNGVLEYTDRDVALALHKAVSVISTSDHYRTRPLHWAQYVHYGA